MEDFDYSNDLLSLAEINLRCEAYITKHYTLGKQLTIERTGTSDEKRAMYTFIDACRSWANSEHPKPKELYELSPVSA